jgi:hypothetical protein
MNYEAKISTNTMLKDKKKVWLKKSWKNRSLAIKKQFEKNCDTM